MNWIKKTLKIGEKIKTLLKKRPTKEETENSDWTSCCKGPVLKKDMEINLWVCPECNKHHRLSCKQRFDIFFSKNNYEILNTPTPQDDPLKWKDTKSYKDRLKEARKKTGMNCAVMIVKSEINNIKVTAAASDMSFIGASIGAAEGEALLTGIQHAIDNKQPFINFTSGGGMRMYENLISLSQMTRITLAINELKKNNLPYIVVMCDATTGGITASYAMLGDINFAEPGSLIAFAGARVIKGTVNEELPEGFQKSEYVQKTGFIDLIVERSELKIKIGSILSILLKKNSDIHLKNLNETSETDIQTREAS
tara:strand:- start:178 stop:1107 length:930 start_codon:yes stop_codon:yes gene_type:complete